ncbi:MAG: hypothetical protein BWY38_00371 [Ignavibacteria bacterium ADurb.Bin266]|jgi:hypothetical protein|nr:MAG: hypothetical protein BWY38_00371 [Ignavibacteria bacterium ADurb.Bin266]
MITFSRKNILRKNLRAAENNQYFDLKYFEEI